MVPSESTSTTDTTATSDKQVGHVTDFYEGVAHINGLPNVGYREVLVDGDDQLIGMVTGYRENRVEALLFDDDFDVENPLYRTGQPFGIPLSDEYEGRVVNGLGIPVDGKGSIHGERTSVFRQAPPVIQREPVSEPLNTGIKVIDTTLPLGRGQRELIIGDRKLGKSAIGIDTVINQQDADPPVFCVYVVCGQKEQKVQEVVRTFREENAFVYTAVVAAPTSASLAEQYLAPFVGCTIGEYYRDRGQDALIVYDDLSKHAKVYRDYALMLERPPGRESYPGDIFSLHARLLERASNLRDEEGGGSLSALPIIETQEGDITSFIPTNVISITDGQIYLERSLFMKGYIPAVNVGLSVSRVGGEAQPDLLREKTGGIRLTLSQYEELQKLTELESDVSEETQQKIRRGQLIREMLKQEQHEPVRWEQQVVLFHCLEEGLLDDIEPEEWHELEPFFRELVESQYPEIREKIKRNQFDESVEQAIESALQDFREEFLEDPGTVSTQDTPADEETS